MNTGYRGVEEFGYLGGCPMRSNPPDAVVVLGPIDRTEKRRRKPRSRGKISHSNCPGSRAHRHNTGDNRNVNARYRESIDVVEVVSVVKKQLSDDVVSAGVDLLLEELDLPEAIWRRRMSLGEPGDADGELRVVLADVGDEIDRMRKVRTSFTRGPEPIGDRRPQLRILRGIATEGEDITYPNAVVLFENRIDFVLIRSNAGEMRDNGQIELIVDFFDQSVRPVPRRSPGSVRDADVIGAEWKQFLTDRSK